MRLPAFAALLLLAACGSEKPETTAKIGDQTLTVDQAESSVTATGADGTSVATMATGASARWPEGAPAWAAAYPGGTIVTTMAGIAEGKNGGMVTFETADAPDKVVAFYKARAADAGLKKVTTMTGDGMQLFAATDDKGDTGVSVQATVSEGKTTGAVTFTRPAG